MTIESLRWQVHINIHMLRDKFSFAICNTSKTAYLEVLASCWKIAWYTYFCIKEVMKDRGLHVAKLLRFKSGPNISV